jgi:hypothetical protein
MDKNIASRCGYCGVYMNKNRQPLNVRIKVDVPMDICPQCEKELNEVIDSFYSDEEV